MLDRARAAAIVLLLGLTACAEGAAGFAASRPVQLATAPAGSATVEPPSSSSTGGAPLWGR